MRVLIEESANYVIYNRPSIASVYYDYINKEVLFIVDGYEIAIDNDDELKRLIRGDKDIRIYRDSGTKHYVVGEWKGE